MFVLVSFCVVFVFKQKTAYEMRISDWSSDVCSSDLEGGGERSHGASADDRARRAGLCRGDRHRRTKRQRQKLFRDAQDLPRYRSQDRQDGAEIGRASCRERGCQYVYISVVAVSFTNKEANTYNYTSKYSQITT